MNYYNKNRRFKKGFFFLLIPIVIAIVGYIIMLLWNAILPDLLAIKKINFWQSVGLFILCKILFGGFRGPRNSDRRNNFRDMKFDREKFKDMNNVRESFREEWARRCKRKDD